jgi:hypothetical protein
MKSFTACKVNRLLRVNHVPSFDLPDVTFAVHIAIRDTPMMRDPKWMSKRLLTKSIATIVTL